MIMKTPSATLILALSLSGMALSCFAADYDKGKEKAAACAACHGAEGSKPITPDIPILAGQHYEYIIAALHQYQKGQRTNPMMMPMAKPLTVDEIENLAMYFSKQSGLSVKY